MPSGGRPEPAACRRVAAGSSFGPVVLLRDGLAARQEPALSYGERHGEMCMLNVPRRAGRHFLQIPGPTPVPDRILRAMDRPVIDHRGPEFQKLGKRTLASIKSIFNCAGPVIIYTASGTGAWEAALVNTLSPGDRVLMCNTGHFAQLWAQLAIRFGLEPELLETDWRIGVEPAAVEARLAEDRQHLIKAVCVLHNE